MCYEAKVAYFFAHICINDSEGIKQISIFFIIIATHIVAKLQLVNPCINRHFLQFNTFTTLVTKQNGHSF